MKRLSILAATVLIVCLTLCGVCQWGLTRLLDDAHAMTTEICKAMENGRTDRALETLTALATLWKENTPLMETLCDHGDLHEVKERIIQASMSADYPDMEDFYSSVALIGEAIEHIREQEGLTWTNLY